MRLGLALKPVFAEIAAARQQAGLKKGKQSPLPPIGGSGKRRGRKAAADAAKAVGSTTRNVERAARVQRADPKLLEKVRLGEVTLKAAERF